MWDTLEPKCWLACRPSDRRWGPLEMTWGRSCVGRGAARSGRHPAPEALPEPAKNDVHSASDRDRRSGYGYVEGAPNGSMVEEPVDTRWQEASPLSVAVLVRPSSRVSVVVAQRCIDVKVPSGSRERHIEEAPFLIHALVVARGHVRRKSPICCMDHMNDSPLPALGRVHRRKGQPVVLQTRLTSQITCRDGWIQGELRDQPVATDKVRCHSSQGVEVCESRLRRSYRRRIIGSSA
jgi:hypothetical protein